MSNLDPLADLPALKQPEAKQKLDQVSCSEQLDVDLFGIAVAVLRWAIVDVSKQEIVELDKSAVWVLIDEVSHELNFHRDFLNQLEGDDES